MFREDGRERRFLLIRNRRSAHWGFPKGHIEEGESHEQTAMREVREETGIDIQILPEFERRSDYVIQGKIEKTVFLFLASTTQTEIVRQEEEIEECGWFSFDDAMKTLNYDNDKRILAQARDFFLEHARA